MAAGVVSERAEQAGHRIGLPPYDTWHSAYIFGGRPLGLDFLLRVMEATSKHGGDVWQKIGLWTEASNLEFHLKNPSRYPEEVIRIITDILHTDYPQRLADSFPEGSAGRELVNAIFFSPASYELESRRYDAGFLLGKTVLDYLPALPPDTVLPYMFGHWVANVHEWRDLEPLKEQIIAALHNPAIPSSLRQQIPQQLVRDNITPRTLETILEGCRMFGEALGSDLRERMPLLFLAGLAENEAMFNAYREDLVRLYVEAQQPAATGTNKKGIPFVSALFAHFSRQRRQTPADDTADNSLTAERRVSVIRDMMRELVRPDSTYNPNNPLDHGSRVFINDYNNYRKAISDFSTLSLDILERHLSDLRQLKSLGFDYLANIVIGERNEGLLPPYEGLGAASHFAVPVAHIQAHLRRLKESGCLEERILDEILTGMTRNVQTMQLKHEVARRNLRAIADFRLPEDTYARAIVPLLQIDEDVLRQGLASVGNIQNRDAVTAGMVLQALPKLHTLFGDKYAAVLSYFEKKHERNDIRLLTSVTNEAYVSEAIGQIVLTSSGRMQGERLVKLAVSLNLLADLNRQLGLGVAVQIVPDLKTSYEIAQTALNDAAAKVGVANLDDLVNFLPWIITKDPTALGILRGEQVQKFGEQRSYALQADVELDLKGLEGELDAYARAVSVQIPHHSEASLNAIREAARYIMAEVAGRKDLPAEVLGEVKPNLDRIITQMEGVGTYELYINPQDLRAQMEALQKVTSCLSPGGIMFGHTQQYLRNPNTWWAVIRGKQGVVGRVTIFNGQTEDSHQAIARVSKVYSQVPFNENEIDEALKTYARETGKLFLERGVLVVPGLNGVYDDYAKPAGPSRVAVRMQ